ncbi:host specificity factor TipJ family phage tail protein [Citrobacter braakii]|uniref:host specificity factor TipJ family phage tail protein n=1 Tax=Citrobacter braakii TaxID=57706 RepID=UPI00244D6BCA|nr:host specificity factor TipJ family phage tail protein [Citrobacter braakii]MDH1756124.1 host specificity factor TipJ family phage tail protein [Citrobacter braakii]MDH1854461.1 host specificity factor TipJ family phage tail protein [Citrobacter braakii]
MTIRIYPSRLPGEPLETHHHETLTLSDWFAQNVEGWQQDQQHPVAVDVGGAPVPPAEWALCTVRPDSDVRMYPVPYGTGAEIALWVAVSVAVASAAYSIYMMSTMQTGAANQPGSGDQLDLNPAKANMAKLGDPIREIFGRYRVWPDYVMQPVSRFVNETSFVTSMFVAVGIGNVALTKSDIRIGNTPISAFGDDVSYTIYSPGADVSADSRTENWYNSGEVGNTGSGTAGLDLGSSGPQTVSISADAVLVSGNTVTLISTGSSDEDADMPESWAAGTILTIEAPASWTVSNSNGYNVIYGEMEELSPAVGMPVSLGFNNTDYDLFVASYAPSVAAVPGVGGSAASLLASAAPSIYDFSAAPATFSITWQGSSWPISLLTNYVTMSGLISTISSQLTGSGLIARDNAGRIEIVESSSPYSGGAITHSTLPQSAFGDTPVSTPGVKSSGGTPEVRAHITLAYTSATGKPFTGIPAGNQRISIGYADNKYRITDIDSQTITVERILITRAPQGIPPVMVEVITVDSAWPGFTDRTLLDSSITGVNDGYDWVGPFLACPDGETTTRFEVNLNFQNGLVKYSNKGNKKNQTVEIIIQYRNAATAGEWTEQLLSWKRKTENQIGFTRAFSVPAGQYEVRMRRKEPVAGGSTRDQVFWQALRSRLPARPRRYNGVTTMALTLRTGNRLAAQSDRRINVTATRLYNGHVSRSISGALYHVLESLGFRPEQIDRAAINALEQSYWTPRGETFDWATGDSKSALEVLKLIAGAGMGYFLLSDGLVSAGREGVKNWTGMITPQEATEELQTAFKAPSQDDYDGVDVTYINGTTWAEETVQCRLPGNPTPVKVEDYKLEGVVDRDRAYRIGMRRLLGYRLQRLQHTTSTEMDALCYQFMDRIILTDDIPGSQTLSCLITDVNWDSNAITLTLSEPPDWSFTNPRVVIRHQDGRASSLQIPAWVDDFTLTIPYSPVLAPDEWEMDSPYIEPPRLLFCSSSRVGYEALVGEITPGSDGTCSVSAIQYHPGKYQYDDATYPGNVA